MPSPDVTVKLDRVHATLQYDAGLADTSFFTADRTYKVKSIVGRVDTAGTDTGAVTVSVTKAASGTAVASGTALHSGTMNLKGTAATNQTLTLSTTDTDLIVPSGTSIGANLTGTPTAAVGSITVELQPQDIPSA